MPSIFQRPGRPGWIGAAFSLGLCLGCAPAEPPSVTEGHGRGAAARPASQPSAGRLRLDDGAAVETGRSDGARRPTAVIEPGRVVPAFRVRTVGGETIDSTSVVGERPFIVVFFASWCPVCARKMPVVGRVLADAPAELLVLDVAFDEAETWAEVPSYVERHGLTGELVRAADNPAFTRSYDPFGGFPLVIVVGADGIIRELQMGMGDDHEARLRRAIERLD